ncbi:MAG: AAA family ATPase [Acidimicrobiia bacterium]|nr:AAA family ATPase [Acidimicrobiia bacterium]MXZ06395.1 AAA family ATPase [Acidimicrobiia bacterium]MYD04277.1 AAA family ATPase [Acidimicrobiia bacterium]MYF26054.1 AAA family ATPase [Acidimicrobiia bacterium]
MSDLVNESPFNGRINLKWSERTDPGTPRSASQLSDGTLRFIALTTLLLQPQSLKPSIILIDEPKIGLHPYAITLLAALLSRAAMESQVIVSAQSVNLLSELEPEDAVVVERKDSASVFKRLDPIRLQDWLQEYSLGELWTMNILGGRP